MSVYQDVLTTATDGLTELTKSASATFQDTMGNIGQAFTGGASYGLAAAGGLLGLMGNSQSTDADDIVQPKPETSMKTEAPQFVSKEAELSRIEEVAQGMPAELLAAAKDSVSIEGVSGIYNSLENPNNAQLTTFDVAQTPGQQQEVTAGFDLA